MQFKMAKTVVSMDLIAEFELNELAMIGDGVILEYHKKNIEIFS